MNCLNIPVRFRVASRRRLLLLTAGFAIGALTLGTVGCDDDEPNDGNKSLDGDGDDPCVDTKTAVAIDEVTALGFSAQDILALVAGDEEQDLTWLGDGLAGPEAGATTINFTFDTSNPGPVMFVDSEPNPDSEIEIDADCSDRLEVSLSLTVSTADGMLDETVETTLSAQDASGASWRGRIAAKDLSGDFPADADPDFDLVAVEVAGTHSATDMSGEVMAEIESKDDGPDGIAAFGVVGQWGEAGEGEGL